MFVALMLAHAEEASPPLIDLDGTTFVQLGLFLILLAVLSKTLFGPYLKMRDQRDRSIDGAKKEAASMGDEGRHIVEDYDRKLAEAKRKGNTERDRLRQEGVVHEREVLGKARAQVQGALDTAQKKIVADTATGRVALAAEATPLARKVASKILGREVA
jgi:F-type H+-transporting ATPase subunit b